MVFDLFFQFVLVGFVIFDILKLIVETDFFSIFIFLAKNCPQSALDRAHVCPHVVYHLLHHLLLAFQLSPDNVEPFYLSGGAIFNPQQFLFILSNFSDLIGGEPHLIEELFGPSCILLILSVANYLFANNFRLIKFTKYIDFA